jgi:hypothetical protein
VSNSSFKFNYLIVTGNPPVKLTDLPTTWEFDHIVVDGSVPPWKLNDWNTPKTHITSKHGAFISKTTID